MAPHDSGKKAKKVDGIGEEAEALKKYLEFRKDNVPSLKNLTALNYGRPAEKHNPGFSSLNLVTLVSV